MDKQQVADILSEIAMLLELKGENPFKTRAYLNAARTLESLNEPLATVVEEDRLGTIKGIGEALQQKISELVTTGRLKYHEDLKASLPAGLIEMMDIPGLGPKKVKAVHDKLGIDSVEALEDACKEGRIAELDGFGAKSQEKILEGIAFRRSYASKHRIGDALAAAQPLLEKLAQHADVKHCGTAGSLRRHKEIIGDIDLVVSSANPDRVIAFFCEQPGIQSVLARGDTKASVILEGGIQADLRVVSDDEYPFALAYFTGSKEHNIVMRQRAIQRGLRLNEYGLFRSKEETREASKRVPCRSEEELFNKLGLQYIPPELREDQGEFEAAEKKHIPDLLEPGDLRGSLHNHSTWSDGHQTLEEIIETARRLKCNYWAITDHSRSSFQAHGLDPAKVRRQIKAVNALNEKLKDEGVAFRLFTGTEVDILGKGKLDFDDDLLADLDVVVASIHSGFTQSEAEMTQRLIKAADNPHVHMLGHLTGRLLLEREAYKVNQQAVIDACAETGTWIEFNASPYRLDLDWRLWHYAKEKGVKCVINCDAHRAEHFAYLQLGAGVARKGWLEKKDVINTLPYAKLRKALQGTTNSKLETRNSKQ